MSGYFLYHSIGMFPGKSEAVGAALADYAARWSAEDDGQWGYALERQATFLKLWGQVLNAPDGTVAQAESVTASLYNLVRALPEGRLRDGKVLIAQDCFPSLHFLLAEVVRRLGAELVTVSPAEGEAWVSDDRMIAFWDRNVRLALLTWVTSTSSHLSDLERLVQHGADMGSLVGVDVTQGIGIRPYDIARIGADFTIGSSLKWLGGVSGAAVLQVSPQLIEECSPELRGWFSQTNPFNWDLDSFAFAPDARRFGNGTPSPLPAVGSIPGLSYVLETGVEALAKDNIQKTARLCEWVLAEGLSLASPAASTQRGGSVMIRLPETIDPQSLLAALRSEGLYADARGAILRLSPGIVTGVEALEHLTTTLGAQLEPGVTA
ncbi:aminotransferase class V-fold PLP-dependent enzyme [Paracoccus rhizosphaerae]|uniref:Aminotransferase class V-fold PLP-dependent enzyme n=1 Tax=Paracoccus rhizosphaerae TaxID=1133347 RepID=A0ABV6CMC3_9RHOB|nr:aminotransferase class V-fold PLP-dependent enzyme [Paracoccus rhizosphaerae]